VLPADEREACERQANGAKERYYAELAEYKKTPQYESYQKYLEDFKAKHSIPTKGQYHHNPSLTGTELTFPEGKRSKLETETSNSGQSSSYDQHERAANRRVSSAQPDISATHLRPESSPSTGPARLPLGPTYPSKPTSPASHPLGALNSPRTGDHYSPISASPRSSIFDASSVVPPRDPRIPPDASYPYHSSTYTHPPLQHPATTPPTYPVVTQYPTLPDPSLRRPLREVGRLPPLTHDDTTLSSESGHSGSGYNITAAGFPEAVLLPDPSKTMRMLPQPIPSIAPSPSPLDRPPPPPQPLASQMPPQIHDYRTQGPLAALVRAGEIAARVADDEAMDMEALP
jgi:hypothetical protein